MLPQGGRDSGTQISQAAMGIALLLKEGGILIDLKDMSVEKCL